MLIRRLARPLLASAFVVDGVDTLMHPEPRVKTASAVVQQGHEKLPSDVAQKLPSDPDLLVKATAVTQVAGGAMLALGKAPRLAALALAATVVPATLTQQDFWAESDPERRAAKRTAFLKDVSLLGGLMIASADTAGKPSLGWRGRRAAKGAATAVSAALPFGAAAQDGTGEALRQQLQHAAERGREFAGVAASKGAALAETAQERGPVLAEAAKQRGAELAEAAKHRGAVLAETAQQRGPVLAEAAKQRGATLAETAQQHGPEWAELAKSRSAELADVAKHRGAEFADVAKHRGTEWAELARHRAAELAAAAREQGAHLADSGAKAAESARDQVEPKRGFWRKSR
ncbi:DoxX family protein [Nocardia cyriacigeorgica]|uniref:DoxX n=1 Tax=Nocardia cyriacigeorgica TaxID=135487 RepID=A0A4U8W570_9NOCA|nr:DoxX family protein [Nocardia cyriacigeorgica]MBF6100381.1 DoxX family protein [Nocardia cyriacigeorgica]MBF6161980.1 DoxX family protein [Nocardia cyriacigeorgica]MBF6200958.1 DoxX family protein [Nocardia cyriacigeorgica]MBF6320213.1 DoxX family protein [Nocardia cyriacigeorgica]MBF6346404.1 DoxX family protein [Nocardia cyriacigeorgica]